MIFGTVTDVSPLRVMLEPKLYAVAPVVAEHVGVLRAGDKVLVMSGQGCFIVIGVYNAE